MPKLGVNIDHVATLRQARRGFDPDTLTAARICESAGADSLVVHLREDRRHIQDSDVRKLRESLTVGMNLEMSIQPGIVRIACRVKPDDATLVPEKRQELTTEGGLDVAGHLSRVRKTVGQLSRAGIRVSLFIDPVKKQIRAARESGAGVIELHTGRYAGARTPSALRQQLCKINEAAAFAGSLGLTVNAGHGLNYDNTRAVARIPGIEELNIGHSIIARAVFVGLDKAVRDMRKLVR